MNDSTGVPCPRCGLMIVYNGNFFCEEFDVCGWALSAAYPRSDANKQLHERCLEGLRAYRKSMGR